MAGQVEGSSGGGVLVVGLGQALRGDDGVGAAVVARWRERYGRRHALDVTTEFLDQPGLNLIDHLRGQPRAILVDAVRGGGAVGTLHQLTAGDLAAFEPGGESAHGWGVAETLALARQVSPEVVPPDLRILGIEVGEFGPGAGLSEPVARIVDAGAEALEAMILATSPG